MSDDLGGGALTGGRVATAEGSGGASGRDRTSHDLSPNPVLSRDLAVLIAVLAVLEGELMVGDVPDHLADRLRDRFARQDLLRDGGSSRALRQAINDLNHRLRYGLGEYLEMPPPVSVPD